MAEQKIELRKIRDFGLNINDSFLFLRQNLQPLLKAFFAICGVFMIGHAIFSGLYQSRMGGVFQQLFSGRVKAGQYNTNPYNNIFSIEYLMVLIFLLLTFVSMKVVLASYLKFYLENEGRQPSIDDIWRIFRKYFFKVFLFSIPVYLITIIGFVFCLAPGFYFWVVLVPFCMVIVIEDTGFGTAFNRCFEIIRQNFWISIAIYLVAYLIYYVSTLIIGVLATVLVGLGAWFTTKNIGATIGIATSFLNIFSYMFYIIYFVSGALHYFTLVEQRDGTGMLQRIDTIGSGESSFDNIEEQY